MAKWLTKAQIKKNRAKYLYGIYNLSPITDKSPFFSKTGCLCCGSPLGGDRYIFTGQIREPQAQIVQLECCVDCYEYFFT